MPRRWSGPEARSTCDSRPMTHPKALPAFAELKEAFKYEPETGQLYRISKNGTLRLCASACNQGYVRVKYKRAYYKASRIIWCLVTEQDPGALTIDHINRKRNDNRWCNLRLADHSLQKHNRGVLKTSTTRLKGAFVNRRGYGKPFRSAIMRDGIRISLGTFDTAIAAHKAYINAGGIP